MKKNTLIPLLLLGGAVVASPMAANGESLPATVKMTTSTPKGSELTFIVNQAFGGFTVDWGDGQQVKYEINDDALLTIKGEVKGSDITISGSNRWTTLICNGCNLTSLDVTAATQLRSLYCQNNQLSTLNLKGMAQLTDLDCSNNKLTKIEYTVWNNPSFDLQKIESYNVADNQLDGNDGNGTFQIGTSGTGNTTLSFVDISNNKYTDARVYASNVIYVNLAGNQLTKANLSKCKNAQSFVLNDNKFTTPTNYDLNLPYSDAQQQIVLDNNENLETMNLSKCTSLTDLSLKNCGLWSLTLPADANFNTLDLTNCHLGFGVIPENNVASLQYSGTEVNVHTCPGVKKTADGKGLYIPVCPSYEDRNNSDYQIDLADLAYKGPYTTVEWYSVADDGTETLLEAGEGKDYAMNGRRTSFFKAFKNVRAKLTIKIGTFKGLSLTTNTIGVGEENATTGIQNVIASNASGVNVEVSGGAIVLSSGSAVGLNVYSADGKTVWSGTVGSTPTTVSLPSGVYIVAGKKVAL